MTEFNHTDLEIIAENAAKTIRLIWDKTAIVPPIVMIPLGDSLSDFFSAVLPAVAISSGYYKDILATHLNAAVTKYGFGAVVFAFEAWLVIDTTVEEFEQLKAWALKHSLSYHPEKREIVLITVRGKAGLVAMRAPITRDGEKRTLGEFERCMKEGQATGRFVDEIYPDPAKVAPATN